MSRLRRDRKALRTARYVRRGDKLGAEEYSGTGRWGMASYRHMAWLMMRRVRATADDHIRVEQQAAHVYRLFWMRYPD